MPTTYVPVSLRATTDHADTSRLTAYAIYLLDQDGNKVSMTYGVTQSINTLLDVVPIQPSVIVRFNPDGSDEILWTWQSDPPAWVQ